MAQSDESLVSQLEKVFNSQFATTKMRRRLIKKLRRRRRVRLANKPKSLRDKLRGL